MKKNRKTWTLLVLNLVLHKRPENMQKESEDNYLKHSNTVHYLPSF